jgi:hypothetical protein
MSRRVRIYLVWGGFAVLAGIIFLQRSREQEAYVRPEEQRRMFAFREPELGQIDLFYQGKPATLMRSPGGRWFLHDSSHSHSLSAGAASNNATSPQPASPPPGEAGAAGMHTEPDAAQAAKLAEVIDFLARTVFDRRIEPTQPLRDYGLENPTALILFYGLSKDGKPPTSPITTLYVGDVITNGFAYYAELPGQRDITLIPLYQVDLLIQAALGIDPHPAMKKAVVGERTN